MEILIFDMDGVLLKPQGYHRALQETVRLAGQELGFGNRILSEDQIARFEALGISSEWHSAALCIAVLILESRSGKPADGLDLDPLFEALAAQPISVIPRKRGEIAIARLAESAGMPAGSALAAIRDSELIDQSLTLNLFQAMILGEQLYSRMYTKPPKFQSESYLILYDHPLLAEDTRTRLLQWVAHSGNGAAIMTNRPSYGPENFLGAPDASFGAELVGLTHLPLVGYGETSWLANVVGKPAAEVSKPNLEHALTAVLAAAGWEMNAALEFVSRPVEDCQVPTLETLRGSQVTVFEDTPAGVIAVQAAADLLNQFGLGISVRKIGIAVEPAKAAALEAVGAVVYPEVNQALASLNHL